MGERPVVAENGAAWAGRAEGAAVDAGGGEWVGGARTGQRAVRRCSWGRPGLGALSVLPAFSTMAGAAQLPPTPSLRTCPLAMVTPWLREAEHLAQDMGLRRSCRPRAWLPPPAAAIQGSPPGGSGWHHSTPPLVACPGPAASAHCLLPCHPLGSPSRRPSPAPQLEMSLPAPLLLEEVLHTDGFRGASGQEELGPFKPLVAPSCRV